MASFEDIVRYRDSFGGVLIKLINYRARIEGFRRLSARVHHLAAAFDDDDRNSRCRTDGASHFPARVRYPSFDSMIMRI